MLETRCRYLHLLPNGMRSSARNDLPGVSPYRWCWDIEGRLVDTKNQPFDIRGISVCRGMRFTDISVRVTIDHRMNVLDVAVWC